MWYYIKMRNTAGTIQNIAQKKLYVYGIGHIFDLSSK